MYMSIQYWGLFSEVMLRETKERMAMVSLVALDVLRCSGTAAAPLSL
jgi:hypothetical protein